MNKQENFNVYLCFDILNLEKQTKHVDNFSKPKLENRKEHVKLKEIENTLNKASILTLMFFITIITFLLMLTILCLKHCNTIEPSYKVLPICSQKKLSCTL